MAAVSRVLRVHRPGHWLDPGPFGCLGVGPPYALGVKAAKPEKQVVVVAGDGAFGLNGFELDTLVRFGLPAVFVIGNDAGWGEIRVPQKGIYGDGASERTLAPWLARHREQVVIATKVRFAVSDPGGEGLAPQRIRAVAVGNMSGFERRGMAIVPRAVLGLQLRTPVPRVVVQCEQQVAVMRGVVRVQLEQQAVQEQVAVVIELQQLAPDDHAVVERRPEHLRHRSRPRHPARPSNPSRLSRRSSQ